MVPLQTTKFEGQTHEDSVNHLEIYGPFWLFQAAEYISPKKLPPKDKALYLFENSQNLCFNPDYPSGERSFPSDMEEDGMLQRSDFGLH